MSKAMIHTRPPFAEDVHGDTYIEQDIIVRFKGSISVDHGGGQFLYPDLFLELAVNAETGETEVGVYKETHNAPAWFTDDAAAEVVRAIAAQAERATGRHAGFQPLTPDEPQHASGSAAARAHASLWIPTTACFMTLPDSPIDNRLVSRGISMSRQSDGTVTFRVSNPYCVGDEQSLVAHPGDDVTVLDLADWLMEQMRGRIIREAEEAEAERHA